MTDASSTQVLGPVPNILVWYLDGNTSLQEAIVKDTIDGVDFWVVKSDHAEQMNQLEILMKRHSSHYHYTFVSGTERSCVILNSRFYTHIASGEGTGWCIIVAGGLDGKYWAINSVSGSMWSYLKENKEFKRLTYLGDNSIDSVGLAVIFDADHTINLKDFGKHLVTLPSHDTQFVVGVPGELVHLWGACHLSVAAEKKFAILYAKGTMDPKRVGYFHQVMRSKYYD
ncbi:unnamed protein product [Sympodiomycopsis kandeliae]